MSWEGVEDDQLFDSPVKMVSVSGVDSFSVGVLVNDTADVKRGGGLKLNNHISY
jgi:hypothetical protein